MCCRSIILERREAFRRRRSLRTRVIRLTVTTGSEAARKERAGVRSARTRVRAYVRACVSVHRIVHRIVNEVFRRGFDELDSRVTEAAKRKSNQIKGAFSQSTKIYIYISFPPKNDEIYRWTFSLRSRSKLDFTRRNVHAEDQERSAS